MAANLFKNCDKRYDWFAYMRIGLYYFTRHGESINFCDIHLGGVPPELISKSGVYSGPKDSPNQIKRFERKQSEKDRYIYQNIVHSDLELTTGGVAQPIVINKAKKMMDIWLFGPLLFEGAPYGSLIVELTGLDLPESRHRFSPVDEKTGKPRKTTDPKYNRFEVIFPKSYGSRYRPCTLWGSSYSDGRYPTQPKMSEEPLFLMDALEYARLLKHHVVLPKNVTKVMWRIEDFAGELTVCQLMERKG
ncbi:MAG: hypothetical protein H6975_07425 [Gammaproteobacteria bacterium]|nr:hypothetical protein [Gammaproteobacteria bacterium]